MEKFKLVHNVETGEITEEALTQEEIQQEEQQEKDLLTRIENKKNKEDRKKALLAKLGITEEEAKLLLS